MDVGTSLLRTSAMEILRNILGSKNSSGVYWKYGCCALSKTEKVFAGKKPLKKFTF